jgi:hypothetical protein
MFDAQQILALHDSKGGISEHDARNILSLFKGTAFAKLQHVSEVKPAAANKHRAIRKVTQANVQLFSGIKDFNNVYLAAVKRDTGKEDFVVSENYFEHTDVFSLVRHKSNGKLYLYAIYNKAESAYFIDGVAASKQEVAALLTPSAAAQLLNPPAGTHNKTNDVEHDVVVRTIALGSIVKIATHGAAV